VTWANRFVGGRRPGRPDRGRRRQPHQRGQLLARQLPQVPSYKPGYTYDDYAPAYRTGYTGFERARANGESWDKAEPSLRSEYERAKGKSRLSWEEAKASARDAWHRVERALPGDADKDGR
jgi:hypothetical protein